MLLQKPLTLAGRRELMREFNVKLGRPPVAHERNAAHKDTVKYATLASAGRSLGFIGREATRRLPELSLHDWKLIPLGNFINQPGDILGRRIDV